MIAIDYLFITILAYHAFKGFQLGFVKIIFEVLTLITSIYVGITAYRSAVSHIESIHNLSPTQSSLLGFFLVSAFVYTSLIILGKFINAAITVTGLGLVNRLFGLALGGIKGILFLIPVLFLMQIFWHNHLLSSRISKFSLPYMNILKEKLSSHIYSSIKPVPKN